MKYIEIKAPAKINFGLNIVSKRSDGFHNLETIFYPINDLFDVIKIDKSEHFLFTCDNPELENDKNNLILKAVKLLEKIYSKNFAVNIHLEKKIPIGAGLGGGSSDAAAVLISLNEMFKLGIKHEQMINLALELGSDVPFFIKAKPSIGTSRGEILKQIDLELEYPILIINPGIHISTKEAFQNITPKPSAYNYLSNGINKLDDWSMIKENIINDFEEYVFKKYPEVKYIKEKMYEYGSLFSLMSGSGSTVFGIFDTIEKAELAYELFPGNYLKVISRNV